MLDPVYLPGSGIMVYGSPKVIKESIINEITFLTRLLQYIDKYRYFFNVDISTFDFSIYPNIENIDFSYFSINFQYARIFNRKLAVPLVSKYAQ